MAERILPLCQNLMAFLVRTQPNEIVAEALAWLSAEEEAPRDATGETCGLKAGSRCHARYKGGKTWFAAEVESVSDSGTMCLRYDDGDRERGVPPVNVRPMPTFKRGEEIAGNYHGKGKWFPGRISKDWGDGRFDIDYDDGDRELGVPLLRIQRRDQPDPVQPDAQLNGHRQTERERALLQKLQRIKSVAIVVLGLDGVGKTTMLKALQGDSNPKAMPSGGFKPVKVGVGDTKVTFFDLGGREKLRDIWKNYYHDVHAFIFMLDASADPDVFTESLRQLKGCINHEYLRYKPLLVYANKQDLPEARSPDVIRRQLHSAVGVRDGPLVHIQDCVAFPPNATTDGTADPRLQDGIEWLLEQIAETFPTLSERVEQDTAMVAKQQKVAQKERERRVFARTLRKAFPDQGHAKQECMTPTEGLEFLAMETGLQTPEELSPDARYLARAVGYEKLALQMIGAMRVPISSRATAMTWAEIRDFVFDVREEMSIPEDELGEEVETEHS